jgi:hypothetical protein
VIPTVAILQTLAIDIAIDIAIAIDIFGISYRLFSEPIISGAKGRRKGSGVRCTNNIISE